MHLDATYTALVTALYYTAIVPQLQQTPLP